MSIPSATPIIVLQNWDSKNYRNDPETLNPKFLNPNEMKGDPQLEVDRSVGHAKEQNNKKTT